MPNVHLKELSDLLYKIKPELDMTYEEIEEVINANGLDNFLNNIGGDVAVLLDVAKILSRLESVATHEQ